MTPERYRQISDIYNVAVELEPREREAFLAQACDGDEELRDEILSLIQADNDSENFISSPALEVAAELLAQDNKQEIVGKQISHFKILSLLGAGGMGEVYLAQDTKLGRKVALKLLPAMFTQKRDLVKRFRREARAASALNHPNIITIHEIGELNDIQFIATEYIKGETLRVRLMREPLSLFEVVDIAIQITGALVAAHHEGIVHRDIKPENIMLRPDGYVKVLDFGLAKLTEANTVSDNARRTSGLNTTESGLVLGTVAYMSPEQVRGLPVDTRTDIFSLGVVLYEMTIGRSPFKSTTPSDVIAAILKIEPPLVTDYPSDYPTELANIIRKALSKERDDRYQTAKELFDDLKSLRRDLEFAGNVEIKRYAISDIKPSAIQTTQLEINATDETKFAHTQFSGQYALSIFKRHKKTALVVSALLLIIIIVSAYFFYFVQINEHKATSIAVLPFKNVNGDTNLEYLSDGITESLIYNLSQLPQLKVIARSSAFKYKGKDADLQSVAKSLGVEVVLTGKVEQRGDSLIVNVELVNTGNMTQIWGEQYNGKTSDLLSLQAEISREISIKLRPKLSSNEQQKLAKNHTTENESYRLYLKGRYFWNKRTNEGYKQAIELFQQAIDKDPNYALAYVGLADSQAFLRVEGETPRESYMKAKVIVRRAMEIDDTLGEAHTTMAMLIHNSDWDWVSAKTEYQRAIELNPNYATAHHWYGELLMQIGRVDESLTLYERALELDPLSLAINADLGIAYFYARQDNRAIEQLQKTIEMDANFFRTYFYLARIYEYQGQYKKALANNQKALTLFGENPALIEKITQELSTAFEDSGEQGYWLKRLELTNKYTNLRREWGCDTVGIYVRLGDKNKAFAVMEKEYDERLFDLLFLKVTPEFDAIRTDPKFQNLQKRIGLTP